MRDRCRSGACPAVSGVSGDDAYETVVTFGVADAHQELLDG